MSPKATLRFDPYRRPEQVAYVAARAAILHESGDQAWVSITEAQATRFTEQGIVVQFFEDADWIETPAAYFDPLEAPPQPPPDLAAAPPAADAAAYFIVQFRAQPATAWIDQIEELGGLYIQDQPVHAAVFRLTSAQASAVAALPNVRWVGIYHPAYALSFVLAGRAEPYNAVELSALEIDLSGLNNTEEGLAQVLFFDDYISSERTEAISAVGATVRADTGYSLIVDATTAQLRALLSVPGVYAVERYVRAGIDNYRAGVITQTHAVRSFQNVTFLTNLDGAGEIVGVVDTGLDTGNLKTMHPDFRGRILFLANLNGSNPSADGQPVPEKKKKKNAIPGAPKRKFQHGTHVTGSIAGNGALSAGRVRGAAPSAGIIFHSANDSKSSNGQNYTRFLVAFAVAHARGARTHNNSWGGNSKNHLYDRSISGLIDRFCFLNPEDLLTFAAGNDESDLNNDGVLDQNSMLNEALAKNALTVGASESVNNIEGISVDYRSAFMNSWNSAALTRLAAPHAGPNVYIVSDNADEVALFSNRGRVFRPGSARRRRVKPDLVAPGTNIVSTKVRSIPPFPAGSDFRTSSVSPADYFIDSGTSMAAPQVSGAAALVRQYYRQLFGQLRRPTLVDALAQIVDAPSLVPGATGTVMAWVSHDAGAGQNHILAARFDRTLARQGGIVRLAANVGTNPAPQLARLGATSYLLHRTVDNKLRLTCFDANLRTVSTFGSGGSVTVGPTVRNEADRRPSILARSREVAVVWHEAGTDSLFFQRFAADTGAALDSTPAPLGTAHETATHPYLVHNGTRYAVLWRQQDGADARLRLRFVSNDGAPVAAQPRVVFQQAAALAEPHFVWDARLNSFLVVWIDGRSGSANQIYSLRVDANGGAIGAPQLVVDVSAVALATVRRPFVAIHPVVGYVLLWEDNSSFGESDSVPPGQTLRFDLYMTFLDASGALDSRIAGNRLGISDTAKDTHGFGCLVNGHGVTPVWQSNDEINSDRLGLYAVNVTFAGRFQVQVDSRTPLIDSGNYVRHRLLEHDMTDQAAVSLAWAGGEVYHLRAAPAGIAAGLELVRTNSDGLPDSAFGPNGARRIDTDFGFTYLSAHWTDQRLIIAASTGISLSISLFDLAVDATPIASFGRDGRVIINEPLAAAVAPQTGHAGSGENLRVPVIWGRLGEATHTLRYALLDAQGKFAVEPRDLVSGVTGTARHGWFHWVESEVPGRAIAAWHAGDSAGSSHIFTNRFPLSGARPGNRAHIQIDAGLPGESRNAVLAPRPVYFAPSGTGTSSATIRQSRLREYGVAWQYRPNENAPWEIRFSRLSREGSFRFAAPSPNQPPARDVPVITDPASHATEPQLVWHADGYMLAWLSQPIAGGNRVLMVTVLDPQGGRLDLNFGVAPANPAPSFQVSPSDADVQDFELAWNGRTVRITWTEKRGDAEFVFDGASFALQSGSASLRHMQMALAVPRKPGPPGYDRAYEHPSSALVRATLFNGATNFRHTALPNHSNDPRDGYGWGRLNLRQSLSPLPPVTFHARDDASVASGHTVRYRFMLPPGTRLLRVTLAWTDPPDAQLVNNLNLRMTTPDGRVFVGNRWKAPPCAQYSDPLPAPPPVNPFESIHNAEQIVLPGAPTLPPGEYVVEVIGGPFRGNAFQPHAGQPFALVFVGSGEEVVFSGMPAPAQIPFY